MVGDATRNADEKKRYRKTRAKISKRKTQKFPSRFNVKNAQHPNDYNESHKQSSKQYTYCHTHSHTCVHSHSLTRKPPLLSSCCLLSVSCSFDSMDPTSFDDFSPKKGPSASTLSTPCPRPLPSHTAEKVHDLLRATRAALVATLLVIRISEAAALLKHALALLLLGTS